MNGMRFTVKYYSTENQISCSAILGKIIHAAYFIEICYFFQLYWKQRTGNMWCTKWFNSNSLDAVIRQNCLG